MLREGKPRAEVVESMAHTFGVSTRAADSYIARVRERWVADSKDGRETERAVTLARLDRLSGKAEGRGAFGAAVSAEKLRAQVNGLLAPQAIEVKATVASSMHAADDDMTTEQIAEEMAAIMACVADFITHGTLAVTPVLQADVRKLAEVAGVLPAPVR